MVNVEEVIEKGFSKITYENQEDKPVFYMRKFNDLEIVNKLFTFFGEDKGSFEYDLTGIQCTVEITENLGFAQYVFKDEPMDYWVFGEISIDEFEDLLKLI